MYMADPRVAWPSMKPEITTHKSLEPLMMMIMMMIYVRWYVEGSKGSKRKICDAFHSILFDSNWIFELRLKGVRASQIWLLYEYVTVTHGSDPIWGSVNMSPIFPELLSLSLLTWDCTNDVNTCTKMHTQCRNDWGKNNSEIRICVARYKMNLCKWKILDACLHFSDYVYQFLIVSIVA